MILRVKKASLYYFAVFLYVFTMTLDESNYKQFALMDTITTGIKIFIVSLTSIIVIMDNCLSATKEHFLLFAVLMINVVGMLQNGLEVNIIILVMMILASRKYELKKITKIYLWALVISVAFVVLSSVLFGLEDKVNIRYSGDRFTLLLLHTARYERHSYGFMHSNQIPFALMTAYLLSIFYKGKEMNLFYHLAFQVINILAFVQCGSRVVFALIALTGILFYLTAQRMAARIIGYCAKSIFGVSALVCFGSVVFYNYIPTWIDALVNFRITYAFRNVVGYGLSILGAGFSAGTVSSTLTEYAILDNGYIMLFIQRGIVMGIIVLFLWINIGRYAYISKNYLLSACLVIIGLANIIDYHLLSYRFLPFIMVIVHKKKPLMANNNCLVNELLVQRQNESLFSIPS